MIARFALLVSVALLLTGCVSKYEVREGGPRAKLRFISADFGGTELVHVTDGNYRVAYTFKQGLFNPSEKSPIQMLGTSSAEETAIRERLIDANAPFRFKVVNEVGATQYTRGRLCELKGEFFPVENEQYELVYESCTARLYKLTAAENDRVLKTAISISRWPSEAR